MVPFSLDVCKILVLINLQVVTNHTYCLALPCAVICIIRKMFLWKIYAAAAGAACCVENDWFPLTPNIKTILI